MRRKLDAPEVGCVRTHLGHSSATVTTIWPPFPLVRVIWIFLPQCLPLAYILVCRAQIKASSGLTSPHAVRAISSNR